MGKFSLSLPVVFSPCLLVPLCRPMAFLQCFHLPPLDGPYAAFDLFSRPIPPVQLEQLGNGVFREPAADDPGWHAAYKKSRHKKEFRSEHAEEIAQHEAAKQAFDTLGGKPIPKVAQLSKEYAALLAEKRAEYEKYKALRQEMITIRTAKQNVDRILGLEQEETHSTEISR